MGIYIYTLRKNTVKANMSSNRPKLIEHADGTKEWFRNGKHHREDGPAVELADGNRYWYLNGKRHREDGPAVEYATGSKAWYLNGEYHREDGPAYEGADGTKLWFLNGTEIDQLVYWVTTKERQMA